MFIELTRVTHSSEEGTPTLVNVERIVRIEPGYLVGQGASGSTLYSGLTKDAPSLKVSESPAEILEMINRG